MSTIVCIAGGKEDCYKLSFHVGPKLFLTEYPEKGHFILVDAKHVLDTCFVDYMRMAGNDIIIIDSMIESTDSTFQVLVVHKRIRKGLISYGFFNPKNTYDVLFNFCRRKRELYYLGSRTGYLEIATKALMR